MVAFFLFMPVFRTSKCSGLGEGIGVVGVLGEFGFICFSSSFPVIGFLSLSLVSSTGNAEYLLMFSGFVLPITL
jgi:hypothetical protein